MTKKDIRNEIIEAQNKIIKLLARNIDDEKVYLEHIKLEEELKIIDLYEQYKKQQSLSWDELPKIDHSATMETKGGITSIDTNAPVEERAESEWNSNTALRAEFNGDKEAFIAFYKANENGQIKLKNN